MMICRVFNFLQQIETMWLYETFLLAKTRRIVFISSNELVYKDRKLT